MYRVIRGTLMVLSAALFTTWAAGRFTMPNVVAWSVFFAFLFWSNLFGRRSRDGWNRAACDPVGTAPKGNAG